MNAEKSQVASSTPSESNPTPDTTRKQWHTPVLSLFDAVDAEHNKFSGNFDGGLNFKTGGAS